MIEKTKPLEIHKDDIFINDKLRRKVEVENLSILIESTKEPLTLSINGSWGTGKTTFVKLLKTYLETKDINSIYFSAWEDDFSKEPLISILGEINKHIEENFTEDDTSKKIVDTLIGKATNIFKVALPTIIKGVTYGVLDIDKGFESAIGAITEGTTKELIESYSKNKLVIEEFQEVLSELIKLIGNDKPFVIFIDELDRCRPLYAIELLERIKHIFGIDNLIFIFSIDKLQLSQSIKSQYGDIDTDNYLRRFFDLEYNLAKGDKERFCSYMYYHKYKLQSILKDKEISTRDFEYEVIRYLVDSLNLTLRELEHIFLQISIVFKTIPNNLYTSNLSIYVFFIILKVSRPSLYNQLIEKEIPIQEAISKIVTIEEGNISAVLKGYIIVSLTSRYNLSNIITEISEDSYKFNILDNERDMVFRILNLDVYQHYSCGFWDEFLKIMIDKIEFSENFVL
jgi:hypothetical protein